MNRMSKLIGVALTLWTLLQMVSTIAASVAAVDARHAAAEAHAHAVQPMLSTPIGALKNATVTCPASNASPPRVKVTDGLGNVSAMQLVNTSATCVQVGGSNVTSTTGGPVGVGCAEGATFTLDGKEMYCGSSTTSSVDVQLLYGRE